MPVANKVGLCQHRFKGMYSRQDERIEHWTPEPQKLGVALHLGPFIRGWIYYYGRFRLMALNLGIITILHPSPSEKGWGRGYKTVQ
jgi:hypothetical protein